MSQYKSEPAWTERDEATLIDAGPAPREEARAEAYQLGDVSVAHAAPPMRRSRASAAPWLLLALLLVAAGAFAYFVYLPLRLELEQQSYALAQARATVEKLSRRVEELESTRQALEEAQAELAVALQVKEQALEELTRTQEELAKKLEAEIRKGDVLIHERHGELVVDLVDRILFDSGAAELNEQGKAVLRKVAETLIKIPDKVIQIGGHTDDVPISEKLADRYPSNWELSTARAINVVRFLQDEAGIPGKRLVAAGFSQYRPVASNATKTGRKKNRRIEVVLLPLAERR